MFRASKASVQAVRRFSQWSVRQKDMCCGGVTQFGRPRLISLSPLPGSKRYMKNCHVASNTCSSGVVQHRMRAAKAETQVQSTCVIKSAWLQWKAVSPSHRQKWIKGKSSAVNQDGAVRMSNQTCRSVRAEVLSTPAVLSLARYAVMAGTGVIPVSRPYFSLNFNRQSTLYLALVSIYY